VQGNAACIAVVTVERGLPVTGNLAGTDTPIRPTAPAWMASNRKSIREQGFATKVDRDGFRPCCPSDSSAGPSS